MRTILLISSIALISLVIPNASWAEADDKFEEITINLSELEIPEANNDVVTRTIIKSFNRISVTSNTSGTSTTGEEDDDVVEYDEERRIEERWERDEDGVDWYTKEVYTRDEDGDWEKVSEGTHREGTEDYVPRPGD